MAFATSLLMGFLSLRVLILYHPLFNLVAAAMLGIICYQVSAYSKFLGKKRGEFEFEFKLKKIDIKLKKRVLKYLGLFNYIRYLLDGMNNINIAQESICKKLLSIDQLIFDKGNTYILNMKLSLLSHKDNSLDKEINYLNDALEMKPEDLLANCRLARCFEYKGNKEKSIEHYQKALKDKSIDSEQLKGLINGQIIRINKKGLMNKPASMGLRYMSW